MNMNNTRQNVFKTEKLFGFAAPSTGYTLVYCVLYIIMSLFTTARTRYRPRSARDNMTLYKYTFDRSSRVSADEITYSYIIIASQSWPNETIILVHYFVADKTVSRTGVSSYSYGRIPAQYLPLPLKIDLRDV